MDQCTSELLSYNKMLENHLDKLALSLQSLAEEASVTESAYTEGDIYINGAVQSLLLSLSRMREKVRHALEGTRACEIFDVCCGMVEESNVLKILFLALVFNSILPVIAFLGFAIVTFITTFAGFLLLEAALLFFAGCAGILFFGAIGVILSAGAIIMTLIYLLYRHAGDIAYKIENFYFPSSSENSDDDMVVIDTDHED